MNKIEGYKGSDGMKKQYEKPMVHMEHFSLSQSVATACGVSHDSTLGHPTYADPFTCGWDSGLGITWVKEGICNDFAGPDDSIEIGCYNNPNGGTSIFSYS